MPTPPPPGGCGVTHSPGPFTVGASRSCEVEILDANGFEIARVLHPIERDSRVDPCDRRDANVGLISSAPDLLKACRMAQNIEIHRDAISQNFARMNQPLASTEYLRVAKANIESSRTQIREIRQALSEAIKKATGGGR